MMSFGRLAVVGAGGHGKVVADAALCAGWQDIVFFDDSSQARASLTSAERWSVGGAVDDLLARAGFFNGVIVAVGNNHARMELQRELEAGDAIIATVVHPSASVSRFATLGPGSVAIAGAAVNVDASIGRGTILNTGATVDHDCVVGEFVHLSPGVHLAGGVKIDDLAWIGIGAVVRENIRVGRGAFVAAGAVVIKDVAPGVTVAGVPARPIKRDPRA